MTKIMEGLKAYFTKRNTFKIVVIELQILGLLLCAVLAMSVQLDLTLQGDPVMTVEKGETFEDPGVIALADGGRAAKVKVTGQVDTQTPGTYTLCYRARYLLSSKEVTRTVHVVDTRPPQLELIGGDLSVRMGSAYQEPGYSAVDNNGMDLSARVQCSGTVDHMKAGEYTITYTVTDDKGRTTTVQRTVTVEPAQQPEIVQPNGKVIYLTFDDGPRTGKIETLLQILDKYNVKATFFVVGKNADLEQNLKAIAAGGHSLGIHSVTHDYKTIYANEEAFLEDLYAMQGLIQKHTGITTTLMRFPGGTSNRLADNKCDMKQLVKTVTDLGFQYFDWNIDSNDAGGANTADQVYRNVVDEIAAKQYQYSFVLMHDIYSYSVEAVERIIQWGLANGYSFQALTPESPTWQHVKAK